MTTTTATATTSPDAPFAGFARLLARVQRPRRNPIVEMRTDDRDRQRLLDELRALPGAPADIADRVRV